MKNVDQCTRCLAGTMRVVRSKKDADAKKQRRKCSNPKCRHSETRDVPSAEAQPDARSSAVPVLFSGPDDCPLVARRR
jgi:hypothetical protein